MLSSRPSANQPRLRRKWRPPLSSFTLFWNFWPIDCTAAPLARLISARPPRASTQSSTVFSPGGSDHPVRARAGALERQILALLVEDEQGRARRATAPLR